MTDLSARLAKLSPAQRKLLEQKLAQRTAPTAEPLAVVGMACRFPGAPNLAAYWRLIRDGIDATSDIPQSRWDVESLYDPSGEQPGKMSVRRAGLVDQIDQFDPQFFGISPREAARMDPQQRMLLEVSWEALEMGGHAPDALAGTPVGVFVGIGGTDYSKIPSQFADYYRQIDAHVGTGNALSIAANRVSYIFDFRGPSLAVDTACSSSTMALHIAAQCLRNGECDVALVGGVNAILTPETTIAFSKAKMLSPTGQCRPFDAQADGYVRGEGCGMLVVKRLKDAQAHGDRVLGIIRGVATNQDGRTSGITAPNGLSQQAVIRAALAQAGLDASQIGYIEAHGTGTRLGDPIEVEALGQVYRQSSATDKPCYVTSVKANVGHMETVSGVAGLIKVLLLMQHEMIAPQLHLKSLNPRISLRGTRLVIPQQVIPWRAADGARIAGVSSFGFGGANTHVIVEAPQALSPVLSDAKLKAPQKHVVTVSAKSAEGVQRFAERYSEYLNANPEVNVADFAATVNSGRAHFPNRAAMITADRTELLEQLQALSKGSSVKGLTVGQSKSGQRPRVAFMFTGQGSQYPGMGRDLFETQPVFRQTLEQCNEILVGLLPQSLLSVIYPGSTQSGDAEPLVHQTQYTQPALFAVEYALAKLWMSWGFEPQAVLGHSVGEYVAACVAGIMSLEDALKLIAHRARLMQKLPGGGKMAAIFASEAQVSQWINDLGIKLSIAAANGPENTVVAGAAEPVEKLVAHCEKQRVNAQFLKVSHAFHSALMEPMLAEFKQIASAVKFNPPRIPLIANVTGEQLKKTFDAEYLANQIRNAVRFADSMQTLERLNLDVYLEVGPAPVLTGMGKRVLLQSKALWLTSLRSGQSDEAMLCESLSKAYLAGCKIDWGQVDQRLLHRRLELPTYPFDRQRCWYESGTVAEHDPVTVRTQRTLHPLLGNQVPTALDTTVFENHLSATDPSYLADHAVQGSVIFPAAGYCETALQAARQVYGDGGHVVEDLVIEQAMFLPDGVTRHYQALVATESGGERVFRMLSAPIANNKTPVWTLHALGKIRHADTVKRDPSPAIDLAAVRRRQVDVQEHEKFYETMTARKLEYGIQFRMLKSLVRTKDEALGEVRLDEQVVRQLDAYLVHPVLGDAVFQSMAGLIPAEPDGSYSPYTYVPSGVNQIRVISKPTGKLFTYGKRTSSDEHSSPESVVGDVFLVDDQGKVFVEYLGVRVSRMGAAPTLQREQELSDSFYALRWSPSDAVQSSVTGTASTWLLFADERGIAKQLEKQLLASGKTVVRVQRGQAFKDCSTSDEFVYEVNPHDVEHLQQLMQRLLKRNFASWGPAVYLWSLDQCEDVSQANVDSIDTCGAGSALRVIQSLARVAPQGPKGLWLVTDTAQQVYEDQTQLRPLQATIWGLGRVAQSEHPELSVKLLDLSLESGTNGKSCLAEVYANVMMAELPSSTSENQIAYRANKRFVARLEKAGPEIDEAIKREQTASRQIPRGPFRLRFSDPGSFDSLYYERCERKTPGAGQVELQINAAGLNFSDVLKAMGLYPGITDPVVPLGIECSGRITAVGPDVKRFKVGDEVFGVAPFSFGGYATTAEYALVHRPDDLDDVTAASLPIAFLTAYYGLIRLADLQPGERVLIHAGAGGVGLAAIQIAQHVGAEVYATAGSESKREFLRSLGVQHVFNSRSTEFVEQIMQQTERQGIDVVLNSLPGAAIPASLGLLRAYGRFLEIGKTDIYQNRMIGLAPFQDNLSYFAIDLDRMLRQRPEYIRKLFADVMERFHGGDYGPVALTEFRGEQIADAFRYMAQRKNIGKVVVSFDHVADRAKEIDEPEARSHVTEKSGSVLITGGLGALGLALARWQVEQGAKHIVLMSRRPPTPEQNSLLETLPPTAQVITVQGDVSELRSLERAIAQIPKDFLPLSEIYHAAGILDDGMMFDMQREKFQKPLGPKVQGTLNLHKVTQQQPLKQFVLFSSIATLMGSPGQANYAAANAFLDAFAQWRHQQGLPATSINWGPWGGAGMATEAGREEQLRARGLGLIEPQRGLQAIELALQTKQANLAFMEVDWLTLAKTQPGNLPPLYQNLVADQSGGGAKEGAGVDHAFVAQLVASDNDQRQKLLRQYFAAELARIMGWNQGQLSETQPLNELGMDSLLAMELKNNLERRLAINIPMAAFMEAPSITSLAERTAGSFGGKGASIAGEGVGEARYNPLIPLKSNGKRSPWFCLHPLGGNLGCYLDLSRAIVGDVPLYGLMGRGSDGVSPPHATMDEMIGEYIAAIREVQSDGPYYLMGWSAGGIFAYELTRKLRESGQEIGGLVLIDTPLPSIYDTIDLSDDARFLFDFTNFANRFLRAEMQVTYEALRSAGKERALQIVLDEAKRQKLLAENASLEYIERLVEVGRSHVSFIKSYDLRPADFAVELICPQQPHVLSELAGKSLPADLGWEAVLGDRVSVHQSSGDHFSMMLGESALDLAKRIESCRERAMSAAGST